MYSGTLRQTNDHFEKIPKRTQTRFRVVKLPRHRQTALRILQGVPRKGVANVVGPGSAAGTSILQSWNGGGIALPESGRIA